MLEDTHMTKMKKILAVALCVLLLGSVFAGCSGKKAEQTTEITDETLLIAYTADNAPFFQIDEKGNASGFEADLIAKIFDSIKDDCKNYAYVKVEPGYRLVRRPPIQTRTARPILPTWP